MANIMLTYRCNLNCPYCFANEFVNKENLDISDENFDKAVDFLTNCGVDDVGLIGGEPLLHKNFKSIIIKLINNPRIKTIRVYTNGLLMDKFIPELVSSKVRMLVNCNSPFQIGSENFEKLVNNLEIFLMQYHMRNRMNIGINIYRHDMDYKYIINILQKFNLHKIRISITVPDFSKEKTTNAIEFFDNWKVFLMEFFKHMDEIQVVPYYDCNKPPYCIWNEEEKKWLEGYVSKYPIKETNLVGNHSFCHPVIDILPNLEAVRCFGLSHMERVKLNEFDSLDEIIQYFRGKVDGFAYCISAADVCRNCHTKDTGECTSGCLGFKLEKINKAQKYIGEL